MKKNKKIANEVKAVDGDVCVPCRFPDVSALKTGLKAGFRAVSADPGSCPGTPPSPPPPAARLF